MSPSSCKDKATYEGEQVTERDAVRFLAGVEIGSVKDEVMDGLRRAAAIGDWNVAVNDLLK